MQKDFNMYHSSTSIEVHKQAFMHQLSCYLVKECRVLALRGGRFTRHIYTNAV